MCLENLNETFQCKTQVLYVLPLSSMFAHPPPLLVVEDIKGWVAELCTIVQLHCAAIDCTVLDHSVIYCFATWYYLQLGIAMVCHILHCNAIYSVAVI